MRSRSGNAYSREVSSIEDRAPAQTLFEIAEHGVDWLTCTCADKDLRRKFEISAHRLLYEEQEAGNDVEEWSFEQFKGLNAGQVAFGQHGPSVILRISSQLAATHWNRFYELSTSVSRIDYQVTFRGVPDTPSLIRKCHTEALLYANEKKPTPEVLMRDSNRTGPTLYLGTRRSNWIGRIYDKAVESRLDHYSGHARAEIQFNKRGAKFAALLLHRSRAEDHAGIGLVSSHLQMRGVGQLFPSSAGQRIVCQRRRTNDDRRLEWIRSQVLPSVKLLIEHGRLPEVLTALGLDHQLRSNKIRCDTFSTSEDDK